MWLSENEFCISPQDAEALSSDVLTAVLNACYEVRYKLVDGAFVLHWARNALSYLHLVALAVEKNITYLTVIFLCTDMGVFWLLSYLKYRFWLLVFFSIASKEPIPRYFFSRTPSEKKYSPGASVVAASNEPIITAVRGGQNRTKSFYYTSLKGFDAFH